MREADAGELRRAERAEAARLGAEFGLGDNVGVSWVRFSPHGSAPLGVIALASTTVVTLAVTIGLATTNALAAVILGLITIAEGVGVRQLNRRLRARQVRRRFCWYDGGVIETHPDRPTPRVLRWADVRAVTLTFNDAEESFNGLSWCVLTDHAGMTASIDGGYPKSVVREVTDLAERMLARRITTVMIGTYDSGEPVIAGGLRIDRTGVIDDRRSSALPWTDIREITVISEDHRGVVDPPSLIRFTAGRGTRNVSLSGLRNGMFLPALLDHAAQRYSVPVHRTTLAPGKGGT